MTQLILYSTDDGKSQIQLRADLGTVWLNHFVEQELAQDSVVNQRFTTAVTEYRRQTVKKPLTVQEMSV